MYFIKDEEFIRGKCPMTKEEVRTLSVCKMNLEKHHKVLDVGAGTGSISIQCSKICVDGKVVAIEKEDEATEIIYKNKEKFNCDNLHIVKGEALKLAYEIDDVFDAIFIGGSAGDIEDIIDIYSKKLKSQGMMILNFITLSNVYKALEFLSKLNYEVECTQISISKSKGKSYMLMANNPIFIVSAKKM